MSVGSGWFGGGALSHGGFLERVRCDRPATPEAQPPVVRAPSADPFISGNSAFLLTVPSSPKRASNEAKPFEHRCSAVSNQLYSAVPHSAYWITWRLSAGKDRTYAVKDKVADVYAPSALPAYTSSRSSDQLGNNYIPSNSYGDGSPLNASPSRLDNITWSVRCWASGGIGSRI